MRPTLAVLLVLAVLLAPVPGSAEWLTFSDDGVARGDFGPADVTAESPADVAARALQRLRQAEGPSDATFAVERVRTSAVGTHLTGREVRDGVAVDGSSFGVHIVDGRIVMVETRAVALPGTPAARPIAADTAVAAAAAHLGADDLTVPAAHERLLVARGDRLADAYRVSLVALGDGLVATVDVAAADGRILAVTDRRRFADAVAPLFDPNPIVTAKDNSIRQPVDILGVDLDFSAEADEQRRDLAIRDYDVARAAAGNLVGPWVDVLTAGPVAAVDGRIDTVKSDPRFEGLMAYAHIDAAQRYFREVLGLTDVNAESQLVVAYPVVGFDNSFYQPANDLLLFGAGGVDDGEDAEVILHELGHAIHDDQVPGWGNRHEGGAMGEGWGDFLAAAYYARASDGFQDECVADWDAVSYSSADPPCLRRTDRVKTYPQDMTGSVHSDGEFWSALLWDVRNEFEGDAAAKSDAILRLVLTSHEFLSPNAEFGDAVAALRVAGAALYPELEELPQRIDALATARGMPLNPS